MLLGHRSTTRRPDARRLNPAHPLYANVVDAWTLTSTLSLKLHQPATLDAATFAGASPYGNGLRVAAATDAYHVPTRSEYQLTDNFTVAQWLVPTGTGWTLFSLNGSSSTALVGLHIGTINNAGISLAFWRTGAGVSDLNNPTYTVTTGQLLHLVGVVENDRAARVYVNGQLAGSSPATWFGATQDPTGPWRFGETNTAANDGCPGVYLATEIYNRPLTDSEVWELYRPSTRWSLYEAPARRLWIDVGAAAAAGHQQFLPLLGVA